MVSNKIDSKLYFYIILGMVIDIYILSLPYDIALISHQDAWISTALGSAYAFVVVILLNHVFKKNKNIDIFTVNKKYYGKVIAFILGFIFLLQYTAYSVTTVNDLSIIYGTYATSFLTPVKINLIALGIAVYAATKGINSIGKILKWVFYIMVFLLIIPLIAVSKGSILNVCPVMEDSVLTILKGAVKASFTYIGAESIMFLYSDVTDKKNLYKSGMFAVVVSTLIYTYTVFITMYYFGPNITVKFYDPFLAVTENIRTPVINSFRYVYVILWGFISLSTLVISSYLSLLILNKFLGENKFTAPFYFIFTYAISIIVSNMQIKEVFDDCVYNFIQVFTFIYVFITFINSLLRKDRIEK